MNVSAKHLVLSIVFVSELVLWFPMRAYANDYTDPVVLSITPIDDNPTHEGLVNFEVDFSEPVWGVDSTDFGVSSDTVGAYVNDVQGADGDSTYYINVNTGSGDGLLELDLYDDNSIRDEFDNRLGGSEYNDGDFLGTLTYTVDKTPPHVISITDLDSDPTAKSTIHLAVQFDDAVSGLGALDLLVDAPGLAGASLGSISGTGDTYTVAVNTGKGNGSIRLVVLDNDLIVDDASNPLDGPGNATGNFASEYFDVVRTTSGITPSGTIKDRTPTYKWNHITIAAKYKYQLKHGRTTVYTLTTSSKNCTTLCTRTPSTVLSAGKYKWRVRALIGGVWQPWSPFLAFKVAP